MDQPQPSDLNNLPDQAEATFISELSWQFRASMTLLAAHQSGFFEALRTPKTASRVASERATGIDVTEKVLITLCALGLSYHCDGVFSLTPLAEKIMLPESPRYIGGVLDFNEFMWWEWSVLPDMLKGGDKYAKRHRLIKELQRGATYVIDPKDYFTMVMHGKAANGGAQFVAGHVDLTGRQLLLDIGGGPGTYSIVMCQRYPQLKAVVWDTPEPLQVARRVIKHFDMEHRIVAKAGNWDTDEFSPHCDVILLSNIAHGPQSNAAMKLAKAFRALEPGGQLIVQEFLLNAQKSGPLPAALFNIMVGAYSEPELLAIVTAAGFMDAAVIASDPVVGSGIITARRPECQTLKWKTHH